MSNYEFNKKRRFLENRTSGKTSWLWKIDPALWIYFLYLMMFISLYTIAPQIIAPLTFGWYLSLIIDAPARLLNRIKVLPYKVAVVLSSLIIYGLILVCLFSLVPIAIEEGGKVLSILANYVGNIELPSFIRDLANSEDIIKLIEDSTGKVIDLIANTGTSILASVVQGLPSALTGSVIFILTASIFTSFTPTFRKNAWRFFPKSTHSKSVKFAAEFYNEMRHFIGGQILIAACIGVFVGLALWILGVPYPLFLGFLAGITNFIPFLGSIITMIPAVLLGFTDGAVLGAVKALAVLLVANQLEAWVLSPKIQGQRMKINWFVILIGIFLFGALLGILGILLSIPIIVFLRKFWVEYVQDAFNKI